ncbi:hypothetical protein [Streptomyces sp. GESEQ-35]|uniref:hypothetical protein n=1 Tax=Streptomyces sp. GESEQ-35 TaxID=2812657 RepID=UPI001B336D1E|nr:hypothetical protein [Streptomyces sp. GESEQ-35]
MSATPHREPGELFGPRTTLFADVLSIGLATTVSSLPLITAPAALSTACAVLRGVANDEPATAGRYFALLRRRLRPGDLLAGVLAMAGTLLVAADLALAGAGLPGAPLFATAATTVTAIALTVALRACARPESVSDWPTALRAAATDTVRDPAGSALILLAVATAALCAWMMLPLAFLVPGPLALALAGVARRRETAGT